MFETLVLEPNKVNKLINWVQIKSNLTRSNTTQPIWPNSNLQNNSMIKDLRYQIEEIDHTRAEISSRGFYAATNATVRRFRDGQRPFTFLFTKYHTR